ncbi:SEL1-like repeat protein [Methylobacter sp. BBA5.1]|uniref:SEL1-like repeat protein n=1 Tax=Methylobacter sp. BBA5.1 TaxID=1495064 RepID=UPI000ADDAD7C|nr:tetratricopeptide repeat protein [Methylobacter sp. BBA5.1]
MTPNNPRTLAELQELATAGDAQAHFELAGYYAGENDTNLGLEWLNKAAGQGHNDAQFALGLFYFLGLDDQQKDRTKKFINQYIMSFMSFKKNEIESAREIAFDLVVKVKLGDGKGSRDSNVELAFAWFQKAAAQNHVEANAWLGQCYRDGIGTKHNDEMAFNCFRLAAEYGWAEAQYDLARCYLEGKGVHQNAALGRQWCEKAAENGFAEAQYLLARCYLDGVGVAQNFEQSIVWLNKASQSDDSVIEDKMMTRLAEAHAKGIYVKQNDTPDNNLSRGEACYQAAIVYFDGRGFATDYEKGMTYLRDAIKCGHAGAKQWLENAFLQFTFPEFIGRDDAEQCYQYAYNWLSKAFEENRLDQEVNFALGVLFALGKGTTQNHVRASEYFYKFHTGDGIDDPNPDYPDELDDFANIYCAIHDENWKNGCFYPDESSGKYFTSQFQSSRQREGNYIVLPSLVMDFYLEKSEFDLLRSYVGFIENSKKIFEQQSTQKQLIKIIFKVTQQEEEIERKNEQLQLEIQQKELLQTKMQKLVEQFTHTLGNVIFPDTIYQVAERLKTNPECRKDVLLLNEAYHSEIIIKLQGDLLRQRHANANPDKFIGLIRSCRRTPDSGDKTKSIADILDYAASRVTARFINQHNASLGSIRDKILSRKNVSLEALKQKFEDDILLNRSLGSVEWINQNLRPFKVVESSPIWQKVCILAESHAEALLFGHFSEVLFNAFKYADHSADEFLTVVFDETVIDGITYLACSWQNPLGSKASNSLGTGKGLDAIQEDLEQLNKSQSQSNSLVIAQDCQQFQVTMFFKKDLLIDEVQVPKIKRKGGSE